MQNSKFFIFTGGPGAGKTTTLALLQSEGMNVCDESGRKIIRQQMNNGGCAAPWKDKDRYAQLMAQDSIEAYKAAMDYPGIVLFDRGIPDTLGYCRLENIQVPEGLDKACHEYRYNENVFLFPFWSEIYSNDNERKQDRELAEATADMMERIYSELGYRIIRVPLVSPEERAGWIKETISNLDMS